MMRSNLLTRNFVSELETLNASQLRMDAMLEGAGQEVLNFRNVAAMSAGAAVFRLFRVGALSLLAGEGSWASRALLNGAALSAEVTSYRATHSLFDKFSGKNSSENLLKSSTWFQNFSDFLAFKLLGNSLRSQSFFLAHTLQSSLAVGLRQIQNHGNNSAHPSLIEQWFEAAAMGMAQLAGQRLFALGSANRFEFHERVLERGLAISLQSKWNASPALSQIVAMHSNSSKTNPNFRLAEVNHVDDILPAYRDTPIGRLLEYHNLGRPHGVYENADLVLGTCMDYRYQLGLPPQFAYVLRSAGANFRNAGFDISVPIALRGIKHVALIGHTQCAMEGLGKHRDAYVEGLVRNAGWSKDRAEAYFDAEFIQHEIASSAQFTSAEALRLGQRFPRVQVAPLYYRVEDHRLVQIVNEP